MLASRIADLARSGWSNVFARSESLERAIEHLTARPASIARRTISRTILAVGRGQVDWSSDYKLFSRSPWVPEKLFTPIFNGYLRLVTEGPLVAAMDDTKLRKTGRKIPNSGWLRDPLSPAFHTNLQWSQRFLHSTVIVPADPASLIPPRALPVRFTETPWAKKPGKRASEEDRKKYRELIKTHNLSRSGVEMIRDLRREFDERGAQHRTLVVAMDGSFCNRTIFKADFSRTELIARTRKDARLCFPAEEGSRRIYGIERFSPESVRQDSSIEYIDATVFHAGQSRSIRYKSLDNVLWQGGSGRRPLRLIVIAPLAYRAPGGRTYRQPAYLLTTDLVTPVEKLLQMYFDRWQIEVCHREEKNDFGVGEAQVWSPNSANRHPTFAVACYSLLHLAALEQFGPSRTDAYTPLPKWRKPSARPSALDILSLLRRELTTVTRDVNEARSQSTKPTISHENLIAYAFG